MHRLVGIFLFLGLELNMNIVKGGLTVCRENKNCDAESVCHEGVCQKCLDCKLLFRKGKSCKLDFSDCGDCLEGYEFQEFEENFTNTQTQAVKQTNISSKYIAYCKHAKTVIQIEVCSENKICPKASYCFSGTCVKCFDCNLYNRFPPVSGCAKQVDECGSCHSGFYEIPVTTYSNSKPCVANILNKTEVLESYLPDKFWIFYILLTITIIVLIVLLFYHLHKKFKNFSQSTQLKKYCVMDPPLLNSNKCTGLYEPSAPALPQNEAPDCLNFFKTYHYPQELSRILNEDEHLDVEFESEEKQNAKIYQNPTAQYYVNGNLEERIDIPHTNNNVNVIGSIQNNESRFSSHSERIDIPQTNNNVNAIGSIENNESRFSSHREEVWNDSSAREESSQPIREGNTLNSPVLEGEENIANLLVSEDEENISTTSRNGEYYEKHSH